MDLTSPLVFFYDPIWRAPTIGCMLMCLAAGLVGTLVFLRKQSLIGEALSHASYPGVILGVLLAGSFTLQETNSFLLSALILIGAALSALLGLWLIQKLEKKLKVPSDAALCFVLSAFFGLGITLASEVQFSYTNLYKQAQIYLYGQAATMTDIHIIIYGALVCAIILILMLFYKELQVLTFDRQFAKTLGIRTKPIDILIFILVILAVIIGIRSVGVVLMSAMLIAPPVAARQFTNRLSSLFILSGVFGILSGFLGNYLSVEISRFFNFYYPDFKISLPTGPMIVLVASTFCIGALLLAPKRGLFLRITRIARFRYNCICENVLKSIWRMGPQAELSKVQIHQYQTGSKLYLNFIVYRMVHNGWLERLKKDVYRLTLDGQKRAAKIIRLHRLWEVYLADYLGVGSERVHRNAEEMEHILTPELEQELILLLNDPKQDPHQQAIPPKGSFDVF